MDSEWFARRTWQSPSWTVDELVRAKNGRTVSVVLPALNEADTVGAVVSSVLPLRPGLVDELVVVDSGSTDDTARVAAEAGARVVHREDVLADWAPVPGKGEVLWRSLAATTGDHVVFLDSDLVDPDPAFVPALLGPLLCESGVELVKGFYRRPLRLETDEVGTGGGRVTELLARPLLAALRPALSGLVQPLGGEYAASRALLESVPFAAGYGVEIGLLLDAEARYGLDALAQVNLGVRKHRNRSLLQLGVMARQILGTTLDRCGVGTAPTGDTAPDGATAPAPGSRAVEPDQAVEPTAAGLNRAAELTQFVQVAGQWLPDVATVPLTDRPPLRQVSARRT